MFLQFEAKIKAKLAKAGVSAEALAKLTFSDPPNPELGDLALGCFPLAAEWKLAPPAAAARVKEILLGAHPAIAEIKLTGPYLNFVLKTDWLVAALAAPARTKIARHPHILFEYSQPNTHKEFHIGHMRNAAYGGALANIWRAAGRHVTAVTYVNDVGAHVAKTLWAYTKFHTKQKPPREKGRWLAGMYVEATRAIEDHPEYKDEVNEILRRLEAREPKITKLWKITRSWSLAGFKQIYKELGIKFDGAFYESDVKNRGQVIVDELLRRGIAQESQGAIIMDFEAPANKNIFGARNVLILRKSDGAGNYATSDLALAEAKFKKYKPDESVVVTDMRQSLYFKQIFATLTAFGFKQKMWHLPYELVTLPEGAMSSRKGNVILYEQIRDEVLEYAQAETKKRHPDWSAVKITKTAWVLAIGAIRFSMIKSSPLNIITFDKKEALSFDGFTAPYLQYTLARVNSIFKKAGVPARTTTRFDYEWNAAEKKLWIALAAFDVKVARAAEHNDPSELAKYCFEIAKAFASFYEQHKVLEDDRATRLARLALARQIHTTLAAALKLLGIPTVVEM